MSELFDSLNLSNSGPSSSQLSSSQPSTSKVFWHASPSPGVLRQLNNWTPSRSQDSPTLPLCTQAFVGELKKLPGALEAQSPLISREAAKRKLVGSSRAQGRNVSDPTTVKEKTRGYAVLEISDDEEEDEVGGAGAPARLLLGDVGESSPESRRRRTMDAGNTGRVREPSSPSELSSSSKSTMQPMLAVQPSSQPTGSHRRLDRRHPRRRKRESLMAGLGFSDESGTDCMKLFEDLQAAIQGIHAPRTATNGQANATLSSADRHNSAASGADQSESARLTRREGLNRTTSAPTSARPNQLSSGPHSTQQEDQTEGSQPRRVFRPVKSDHDVFNAVRQDDERQARILQPRVTNVPAHTEPQSKPADATPRSRSPSEPVRQPSQSNLNATHIGTANAVRAALPSRATLPRTEVPAAARHEHDPAVTATISHDDPPKAAAAAAASPVKRSARIEAMQQTSTGKKLGVRAPSAFTKAASASPRKAGSGSGPPAASRKASAPVARTRPHALPGMSQARQPGLPRTSSQYIPSASQAAATTAAASGPAAPFRPPAISRVTPTRQTPRPAPVSSRRSAQQGRIEHAASSDDSFADDDAFLALACELEY